MAAGDAAFPKGASLLSLGFFVKLTAIQQVFMLTLFDLTGSCQWRVLNDHQNSNSIFKWLLNYSLTEILRNSSCSTGRSMGKQPGSCMKREMMATS